MPTPQDPPGSKPLPGRPGVIIVPLEASLPSMRERERLLRAAFGPGRPFNAWRKPGLSEVERRTLRRVGLGPEFLGYGIDD